MPNTQRRAVGWNADINKPRVLGSTDEFYHPGSAKFDGPVHVPGGVIAVSSEINLGDRYIMLNADHTGASVEDSGIIFNVSPDNAKAVTGNLNFSSATTLVIPGVDKTSDYPSNALIVITGAEEGQNDGIYQIHSSSFSTDTTITIKDDATNTPSSDVLGMVQTSFDSSGDGDDDSATVAPTTIMVLKTAYDSGTPSDSVLKIVSGNTGGSMTSVDILDSGDSITASSIAADDITIGDAAVSISTSSGDVVVNAPTGQSVDLKINAQKVIEIEGSAIKMNQPIDVSSAASSLSVLDNDSGAFIIKQGANAYLTIDTTDSAEKIILGKDIDLNANLVMDTQATDFSVIDNNSAALAIKEGSNAYLTIDTTNSQESVLISQILRVEAASLFTKSDASSAFLIENDDNTAIFNVVAQTDVSGSRHELELKNNVDLRIESGAELVQEVGARDYIIRTVTSSLVKGNVLYIKSGGTLDAADDNDTQIKRRVVAILGEDVGGSDAAKKVMSAHGKPVLAKFKTGEAPSAGDEGKPVFLSDSAGELSITEPGIGDGFKVEVGYVSNATASSGLYEIIFAPKSEIDMG